MAFKLVRVFGDVMTNKFYRLAFGVLNGWLFPHDSLGDLDDFVDELNIVLDVVPFDIQSVNNRNEGLRQVVKDIILQFAIDRVHLGNFEINYLNEVVGIWDNREDLLFALL